MNYFELYGITPGFTIDAAALKKKFYELSRQYHPDFNGGGTASEQEEALEISATINEAYKTLQNPDLLIKYVLGLKGMIQEEEKYNLPPDFLMEVMDLNEQVMELDKTDTAAVNIIKTAAKNLQDEIHEAIAPHLANYSHDTVTEKELLQIKDYYYKKKYLDRILSGLQ